VKVLHCIPSIDPKYGGPSKAILDIAHTCSRIGLEVSIAFGYRSAERQYISEAQSQLENVTFWPFLYSFPERFSASKQMVLWLKEKVKEFDVIHVHAVYSLISLQSGRLAFANSVPYVLRPAGSLDRFDLQKKKMVKYSLAQWPVRNMLKHAAYVHCTSQQEADNLETFGTKPYVRVLSLPVHPPTQLGDRTAFRSRYGFAEDDFVWLFMSRIDYKKGLDLLVPALAKLSQFHPMVKLAVAGVGSKGYEQIVRDSVAANALQARVVFCGFLSGQEKMDAYYGSDCFVLPSFNENFGIAVVEALGAGLPVLISKNVYIWKEIVSAGAGWACDVSAESLHATMRHVLESQAERNSCRRNAKSAAESFSPERLGSKYFGFYREIVGSHT
jgi:glycosyltransferase involved in cell wall biosynthesis